MTDKMPVIVVDDDENLVTCWRRLIDMQADMRAIDTLFSADELVARVPSGACIVLLDLSMPGRDPLLAASELRETKPDCRVIIYSGRCEPETIRSAFDCGAWGIVDKLTRPEELLAAIRRVANGEACFPERFVC